MTSYESYRSLIMHLDDLVRLFENHPDAATREQAAVLLEGLDALHRSGLERMMQILAEKAAPLAEELRADPVAGTLLGLYGLADLKLPAEPGFVPLEDFLAGSRAAESD